MSAQEEKNLQRAILAYLATVPKCFAFEIYNGGIPACARGNRIIYKKNSEYRPKGIPDIFVAIDGTTFFIETKTKKGVVSADQKKVQSLLDKASVGVLIARSIRDVQDIVYKILSPAVH